MCVSDAALALVALPPLLAVELTTSDTERNIMNNTYYRNLMAPLLVTNINQYAQRLTAPY